LHCELGGLLASAALALGCTTALTPAASRVRITTNPEVVRTCEYRGDVAGNSTSYNAALWSLSGWYGVQPSATDRYNAEAELRNRAGAMDADVVFINTKDQYRILGEAYQCAHRASRPPPATNPRPSQRSGRDYARLLGERTFEGFPTLELVSAAFDQLAARGGIFASLSQQTFREGFFEYLFNLNVPVREISDSTVLESYWVAYRRSLGM